MNRVRKIEDRNVTTLDEVLALLRAHGGSGNVDWSSRYQGQPHPNPGGFRFAETYADETGTALIIRPVKGTPPIGAWTTVEEQIAILRQLVDAGARFNDQDQVLALIGGGS